MADKASPTISWKRNFYTLWIAELCALIGFQSVQPFLPYYIQEFDVKDLSEALIWSGYMGTFGGLAMALSSPFWGALADRSGRKPMVVRAMLGGSITIFLMSWVTSVEQLVAVRILQGAMAGTVTACVTLVSTTVPKPHLGYTLGMMQGAFMLGTSLGPLFGGPLIDLLGYHDTFIISGILMVFAGVAVQLWVKEDFSRKKDGGRKSSGGFLRDTLRLLRLRPFLLMLISLILIQFAFGVTMPVLPLFLQYLAEGGNIVSTAGLIFAMRGLVGALSSMAMGRWSYSLGPKKTMLGALAGTALFLGAQGMATSVTMLAALTIAGGLAYGGIRPLANFIIADVVPQDDRGKAFGITTSASALGFALGPVAGAYIGAEWGFRSAFFTTAVLFALVSAWVWMAMQNIQLGKVEERRTHRDPEGSPPRRKGS